MKAIRFHEYGDIDVLRYEETPTPRPRSGEALVAVAATAFNPVDTWFRAGIIDQIFPVPFPHTLGLDLAGTVVAHGPGTEDPAIGTEVIGFLPMTGPGAAAEYVTAPAEVLVRAPANIPLIDAAAIPVPALTAWQALFEHGNLVAGQSVLVNGAGGGVGGFVVQLAKQAGATVIATASPRSADPTRAAGADHIIDYTAATITDTLDAPVDLAINLVAGTGDGHREPAQRRQARRNPGDSDPTRCGIPGHTQRVVFFSVRSDTTQLTHIVELIDSGQLHLDISARRPLSDTAQLHQQSEDGALRGRTLLIP